jgi:hypothetical protein
MKNLFLFFLLAASTISLTGCLKDKCDETFTYYQYDPIYLSIADVRATPIIGQPAQEIVKAGRIYVYQNLLLVNELEKGVHIFDNANPAAPKAIKFIPIGGNHDMAVRNGMLYADNYTDLVVVDLNDINNIHAVHRVQDAFAQEFWVDEQGKFFAGYKKTNITQEMDCNIELDEQGFWKDGNGNMWNNTFEDSFGPTTASDAGGGTNGTGGSMARFTLTNHFLYIINQSNLYTYNVDNVTTPVYQATNNIAWGIETIFPYGDGLFIGANNGLHIFTIGQDGTPTYDATLDHVWSCDPVVVENDKAYVTLRSANAGGWGFNCAGAVTNSLEIIDVSNRKAPVRLATYDMTYPMGLGISDGTLFICDGQDGLKVFDATTWQDIPNKQLAQLSEMQATDVIVLSKSHVIMMGDDGLAQYDFSNVSQPQLLSTIQLKQ